MLRREGVDYLGTTWAEPAPAAPLAMGRGIRTAGGIRCLSSTRGIECSRGRFGFVIGDRSVVVIRDGVETRFSGSEPPPPPPPPDPLPTPAPVAPDPGYVGSGTEWIQEVSRDGAFIVLSDGSVWEVVGHHRYRSTLWLITHDVVVLDDGYFHRLVNLDRDDSVDARFLGYR